MLLAVFVLRVVLANVFSAAEAHPFPKSSETRQEQGFNLTIANDGSFVISIDGEQWLQSAPPFMRVNGKTFSAANGTLVLSTNPPFPTEDGFDDLGEFTSTSFTFVTVGAGLGNLTQDGEVRLECNIRIGGGSEADVVVFTQRLPDGVPGGGNVGDLDGVITSFPGFEIESHSENLELGFLSTGGHMLGQSNLDLARWEKGTYKLHGGASGGILVIFDKAGKHAITLTPYDNFMRTNLFRDIDTESISFGVMGGASAVPAGYTSRSVLVRGDGIRKSVESWGKALRIHHGTLDVDHASSDLSVTHLGYYTDNGAYYYYNTEEGMNYEETVHAVVEHYKQLDLPIKYFQLDSWWYYKGLYDGVKNWTNRPDVFPSGLRQLHETINMPIVAHNRYFAPDAVYAKQNGGEYDFVVEPEKALPTSQQFWDDLLTDAAEWGVAVYEQDWLDRTYLDMTATQTDLNLGTDWLAQMHRSAEERGINVQYCMALTRFGLESVKHPRVTQIRVSEDYAVAAFNWKIGITSMIAHALGKAPFKDTFRTELKAVQDLCSSNFKNVDLDTCTRELHPALHTAISALSAGPVGPGDRIGGEDVDLLRKLARADGMLLKPDRPSMAINLQMIRAAFGDSDQTIGPKGEVWSTIVNYENQRIAFGIIFYADLKQSFDLSLGEKGAEVEPYGRDVLAYRLSDHGEFAGFQTVLAGEKLTLEATSLANYSSIWYTSPVINVSTDMQIAILGEMNKWVPMSKQRTVGFRITQTDVEVDVEGSEGEIIEYTIAERKIGAPAFHLMTISCTFGPSGEAVITYSTKTCFSSQLGPDPTSHTFPIDSSISRC